MTVLFLLGELENKRQRQKLCQFPLTEYMGYIPLGTMIEKNLPGRAKHQEVLTKALSSSMTYEQNLLFFFVLFKFFKYLVICFRGTQANSELFHKTNQGFG
jgi:hypothetical protein